MPNGQMNELRELIRSKLHEKRISAREASAQAGCNKGFIGDFLEGRAKAPSGERLQRVAEVLGLEWPVPASAASGMQRTQTQTNNQHLNGQTTLVPLLSVRAPAGGQFMQVPEEPAGFVPNIPALEHITGAYAFTVPNDSNEPRYLPGEIVYVSPVAIPRAGDFVFFRLADGRAGVSRLQELGDERITIKSLTAARATSFPVSDVVVMHRIVASVG